MTFEGIRQDIANTYAFFSRHEPKIAKESEDGSELAKTLEFLINSYDENEVDKFLKDNTNDVLNKLRDLISQEYNKSNQLEATQKLLANLYSKILKIKVESASIKKGESVSSSIEKLPRKIFIQEGGLKWTINLVDTLKIFALTIWLNNFSRQYALLRDEQKFELLHDLSDEQILFFQSNLEKIDPSSDLNSQLTKIKVNRLNEKLPSGTIQMDIGNQELIVSHEEFLKDSKRILDVAFSEKPKHQVATKYLLSDQDINTQSLAKRILNTIAKFFI